MSIKLELPKVADVRPKLTVIGVGGAGCNAINNMIAAGLTGIDFVAANTDAQSLAASSAQHRLQLGANLTGGLGAGSKPEIGEAAAEEAAEEIRAQVAGSHMVFVAAGMGGGTGTGAAAVIARLSRQLGVLTVGVVTKPFQFEGARRMRVAEAGVAELKKHVDTLIVIPNQNLFRIASEKTTFAEAFLLADQVLYSGVACIVDLILKDGLINLDFADVRTIMIGMGTAMMGTGEAFGERRAIRAAEEAIMNPLLDDVSLKGAKGLLLSIAGGPSLTLYEVDEAATRVRREVDPEANVIVGASFDETLEDRVRVSIVASGMARLEEPAPEVWAQRAKAALGVPPDEGDVARRLREALQHGDGPPAHAEPQSVQTFANEPRAHGAGEPWQAPGNVVIEEGPPQLAAAASRPPPLQSSGDLAGAGSFTPAPTQEIRRVPRRMPAVEEFPAVGQRDYRANTAPAQDDSAGAGDGQRADVTWRRPSLFERLAGRVWRGADSSPRAGKKPAPGTDPARSGRRKEPHFGGTTASDTGAPDPKGVAEMPVFFARDRK